MALLDDRYRVLRPSLHLLADEAVLAQAWKKSDAYIRRHNWYADLLELDCTLVDLPQHLAAWSDAVRLGKIAPDPMRLIPAPKNARWHFPRGVNPAGRWSFNREVARSGGVGSSEQPKPDLRPLAHLGIRDQTYATAVMLCVADAVETLQGNTALPNYQDAQRCRVYSYGNRLFCDWKESQDGTWHARFRWGNARTYTQFFQDYQRFLARPAQACEEECQRPAQSERLYVVKFDISKFYDQIDRGRLVSRLRRLYRLYAKQFDPEYDDAAASDFWHTVATLMSWSWDNTDSGLASLWPSAKLPDGLPQGMVSSGFFANAYLLAFDRRVGKRIGKQIGGSGKIRLVDYCRYVDDIRIVVAVAHAGFSPTHDDEVEVELQEWLSALFRRYSSKLPEDKQLRLNSAKTELTGWEDLAGQGRSSQYMMAVQSQISVVPDVETLQQATASLDHLLRLAEAFDEIPTDEGNSLELSRIAVPRMDVRDDTIQRFAANRLTKVLRLRKSMATSISDGTEARTRGSLRDEFESLDFEMETMARRLVACWARNPALVTVLRRGLDLFPDPLLLDPVLEALQLKLRVAPEVQPNEREVAQYVLAEVLKAGAVETGARSQTDYPAHANIQDYRARLSAVALEFLHDQGAPWFVKQQAAMFLATHGIRCAIPDSPDLVRYAILHSCLRFESLPLSTPELLPIAVIAQKIKPDTKAFALWCLAVLKGATADESRKWSARLALIEPSLLIAVVRSDRSKRLQWSRMARHLLQPLRSSFKVLEISEWGSEPRPLSDISQHSENPFVQENALLKLAAALLKDIDSTGPLDQVGLKAINVSCSNWETAQKPRHKISVSRASAVDPILEELGTRPSWCSPGMEWAFALGRLLRSAIVGEDDYTFRHLPLRSDLTLYGGMRSTWFKRRFGLTISSEGNGKEPTPISPWLTEFLLRLLQWPGIEITGSLVEGFESVKTPSDLLKIVKKRLAEQEAIYGKGSNLPLYRLTMTCADNTRLDDFRVAIVQCLIPGLGDFSKTDLTRWTPQFRRRHRRHLASMCKLVHAHLTALDTSQGLSANNPDGAYLDLIVFPELAVHPDDMDLLYSLSDRTKAAIFAGQTHFKHPFYKRPINRAAWILRTRYQTGRQFLTVYQGKQFPTDLELGMQVRGHRPYQILIELSSNKSPSTARLTGAICYDATDLKLAADLRDVSDLFVIAALNQDINTFDAMTDALHFHMYQPVVLANAGAFGGSNAVAPYSEHHRRLIAHVHGNTQAAVSLFNVDLLSFKSKPGKRATGQPPANPPGRKTPPAGYIGRS